MASFIYFWRQGNLMVLFPWGSGCFFICSLTFHDIQCMHDTIIINTLFIEIMGKKGKQETQRYKMPKAARLNRYIDALMMKEFEVRPPRQAWRGAERQQFFWPCLVKLHVKLSVSMCCFNHSTGSIDFEPRYVLWPGRGHLLSRRHLCPSAWMRRAINQANYSSAGI